MQRPKSGAAWMLLAAALCACPAGAIGAESAEQCAGIADDSARLACYDGIFRAPGSHGAAAAGAATTVVTNPKEEFGLSESAKRARDPVKAEQQLPQSITEKVAAVGYRSTGELVVTLANAQVWMQLEPTTQARVAVGDVVTIRKASLGSFQLVTASKIAMRVRRIK
ncbi:MAG: hypothetical protein U1F09_11485 [Steroidobacteraceae bacterium]